MRLDKYLKVARILKRRSVSKELADQDRVIVNGRKAKPSTDVKYGDIITIFFGNRELTVKVLDTPKQVSKNDATLMFEVVDEKFIEKKTE
ncbi:ribosomal 50S subunit-recycling heat shock protein [Breznakia sp. PF5-3]|uniref:RNA-binding S4 domain-containing protein n=1 Tax=unclassified Breznakia TaxID=2623764 RepID=UPI0024071364|nr:MULTISPECIES: RNA-binding S4 domain-containing protein [unclassified Breznakia]MDF9825733.1 ribosomal 50S subunit-recycling heat shock protein [Breznakia sp. PM6-1]MDF9836079.1 ribosomal 50S subunit-recycling heat shock protein [Breznakia sp. PF5-3]MDF9838298.1 ribosomal 50S subunit-recycling heat shock protein [Breznakia sp. PFB2-8]MDF9860306.1 ribosomal 50S subunit-recycling heat shock protein [Breznakia sp. PH5-24]